jgi:Mg/Co/Ni transporter MgtE
LSARAASRLEGLGFTVHRYQAGKADWFAAGLPREGKDAGIPRVADIAAREVPTARTEEKVGEVRKRLGTGNVEPLIVVDADRVVLGLVTSELLNADPQRLIEDLMDPAPVTFRPNLRVGEMPAYFKKEGTQHALVTTSDGILVGLVHRHSD